MARFFKCIRCRYVLKTKGEDHQEGCPWCRGYMQESTRRDEDVKAFLEKKIRKR